MYNINKLMIDEAMKITDGTLEPCERIKGVERDSYLGFDKRSFTEFGNKLVFWYNDNQGNTHTIIACKTCQKIIKHTEHECCKGGDCGK